MFSHDAPRTSVAQSIQRVSGKTQGKKHAWNLQGIKLHTWEDVRLLRIGLAQKLSNTAYDNMISTETLLKMSQWHLSS